MVAVPGATDVTSPTASTLAIAASLVVHAPKFEVLFRLEVEPLHIAVVPVMEAGAVFTKTDAVAIHKDIA